MSTQRLKTTISVLIVYYHEPGKLNDLLRSLINQPANKESEVIIVNNSKYDIRGKITKSVRYKYIKSPANIGYGRGNNLGAKAAKGEYLLILNPDTVVKNDALPALSKFLDKNKNTAVVAPNLTDHNGKLFDNQGTRELTPLRAIFSLTILSKLLPNNRILRDYYLHDIPKEELREVDVVPGTALMIRRKVFEDVAGFDPNFFMYFEESDLCKRIKAKGWKIYMIPDAVVEHDWSPNEGGRKLKRIFAQSRFYYFRKHYGYANALVVEYFSGLSKNVLLISALVFGFLSFIFSLIKNSI